MLPNKRGSIFLITLTLLTVVFIIGFAFTFFTGHEDYSSAMSYESEVAFNLAESAIEEFVARLKNSLNHDDNTGQLYKVLRSASIDFSKEITLDSKQVADLTAYTRDIARQIYGIQFNRGLVESDDFDIKAVLKFDKMYAPQAKDGETVVYSYVEDKMEKQGQLTVTATVEYKGHKAKISLSFLLRVVKTFFPPFNYFTLFIRDATVPGGSYFTPYKSAVTMSQGLRLDNGWHYYKQGFDPTTKENAQFWEEKLSLLGESAVTPPGRVYLGQELGTYLSSGPGMVIRSTNGAKMLYGENLDPNAEIANQMNCQENAFLRFDVPWTGMKDYVKKYMELQGQQKTKEGWLFTGWGNKNKLRVFNVGSGKELVEPVLGGAPSFINCFQSYLTHTQNLLQNPELDDTGREMVSRMVPSLEYSGFHPWGAAPPTSTPAPKGSADFTKLSPTLVYGPAMRQYFRAVQFRTEDGVDIELPFVASETFKSLMDSGNTVELFKGMDYDKEMTASQAEFLFLNSGVSSDHVKLLVDNWDKLPDGLREYEKYYEFMSNSGAEVYNRGLANLLNRINGNLGEYEGKLEGFMEGFLENYPYPYGQTPKGMEAIIPNSMIREYFEGPLSYVFPDRSHTFRLDFYFMPRCTEDFFRGRTTVAIGGVSYDRFEYKYLNDVQGYRSGANNVHLQLNGILSLNDNEPLGLRNLLYEGHGIIYSSPMLGGGKVVIAGDLLGVDTDEKLGTSTDESSINYFVGNNMLTIIAPQIVIDTSYAQRSRCFVEANLISLSEPLIVKGDKPITIKGTVVTPYLNMATDLPQCKEENIIIYNPLNGVFRNQRRDLIDSLYVAKIVTGGVGKFDWKYEK